MRKRLPTLDEHKESLELVEATDCDRAHSLVTESAPWKAHLYLPPQDRGQRHSFAGKQENRPHPECRHVINGGQLHPTSEEIADPVLRLPELTNDHLLKHILGCLGVWSDPRMQRNPARVDLDQRGLPWVRNHNIGSIAGILTDLVGSLAGDYSWRFGGLSDVI